MKKYALILALALAPVLLAGSQTTPNLPVAALKDCDIYGRHPVLLVDVSGGTLLGPMHRHLAVYSDGSATLSSSSGLVPTDSFQVAHLSQQDLDGLLTRIQGSGAHLLCDQEMLVADIPLTTVTVFGSGKTTRAHSFSYWIGTDQYAGISSVLNAFLAANFK